MFQEHAVCALSGKQPGSSCEVCCSSESFHGQNKLGLCSSLPQCTKHSSRRKHSIAPHLVRKSFPSPGKPECSPACSDRKPMNHPHLQASKTTNPEVFQEGRIPPLPSALLFCFHVNSVDHSLRGDGTSAWEFTQPGPAGFLGHEDRKASDRSCLTSGQNNLKSCFI